jgi:hypothetical protein
MALNYFIKKQKSIHGRKLIRTRTKSVHTGKTLVKVFHCIICPGSKNFKKIRFNYLIARIIRIYNGIIVVHSRSDANRRWQRVSISHAQCSVQLWKVIFKNILTVIVDQANDRIKCVLLINREYRLQCARRRRR